MPISRRSALSALTVSGLAAATATAQPATQPAAPASHGEKPPASILRRRIPRTGELVPAIGLGTYSVMDTDPAGDLSGLIAVMQAFLAAGGSVIDSSPMYGRSEEVVGKVLAAIGRTDLFYATKVWTDKGDDGGRQAGIDQMAASARLMGAKVMDLMQIHNLVAWQTHLPTLRDMKKAGAIRYLGITEMRDFDLVEKIMRTESIDFIQIPYSTGDRRVEDRILPAAADTGTAVLVMRPFGAGKLLADLKDRPLPDWASEIDASSWAQMLLKFILAHPAVTCPIPATSKAHHMVDNMGAGVGRLPDEALRKRMVEELGT
jgi:aryl-alcohol dehydrogenase-like predicted oxidoreductase